MAAFPLLFTNAPNAWVLRRLFYAGGIEMSGLLGFVVLAQHYDQGPVKYGPLVAAFCVVCVVLLRPARSLQWWRSILFAFALAMITAVAIQALGFTLFPGLVKDIAPFSLQHFATLGTLIFYGWIGHVALMWLLRVLSKRSIFSQSS